MADSLVDFHLDINRQAWAVAHYLSDLTLKDGYFARTSAWYNGRERGIVFWAGNHKSGRHVIVFEHRNSDDICALKWDGPYTLNPPTITHSGKSAYPTDNKWDVAHTVGHGEAGAMADWIRRQLDEYVDN